MKRKFTWLLVFIWVALIFWFSSQAMKETTQQTYDILVRLGLATKAELIKSTDPDIALLKFLIRKGAHLILFTVMGSLMTIAVYNKTHWRKRALIMSSWLLTSLLGVLDEIHQYFVPGRSMLATDMLLDSAGALLGVIVTWWLIAAFVKPIKKDLNNSKTARR